MKIKIIPFDLETAKKIQAGEIKGKIITKNKIPCRIVAYCNSGDIFIQRVTLESYCDWCYPYTREGGYIDGYLNGSTDYDLVLEVPYNEPQFKPFDKVLVRCSAYDYTYWQAAFYSHSAKDNNDGKHHVTTSGAYYMDNEILPYEGNENLVGTTDKPKEE